MAIPSLPAAATANAGAAAPGAPPEGPVAAATAKRKPAAKTTTKANPKATPKAKTSGAGAPKRSAADAVASASRFIAPAGDLPALARAAAVRVAAAIRSSSSAGWATASSAASKSTDLAFLKDPKLSIEEKLIKLLGVLNAKWDKEIQGRLDQIASGEKATSTSKTSTTSKSKSNGLLGSLAGAFSGALGGAGNVLGFLKIPAVKSALKKLGGPVLAAAASAFGFPAAAPILLKYGPDVVDAAVGIASAAGGSASKTSLATSGGTALGDSDRQTIMMEIQNIRQKQQEMFGLVSNILKAAHDTRLSIINNIR